MESARMLFADSEPTDERAWSSLGKMFNQEEVSTKFTQRALAAVYPRAVNLDDSPPSSYTSALVGFNESGTTFRVALSQNTESDFQSALGDGSTGEANEQFDNGSKGESAASAPHKLTATTTTNHNNASELHTTPKRAHRDTLDVTDTRTPACGDDVVSDTEKTIVAGSEASSDSEGFEDPLMFDSLSTRQEADLAAERAARVRYQQNYHSHAVELGRLQSSLVDLRNANTQLSRRVHAERRAKRPLAKALRRSKRVTMLATAGVDALTAKIEAALDSSDKQATLGQLRPPERVSPHDDSFSATLSTVAASWTGVSEYIAYLQGALRDERRARQECERLNTSLARIVRDGGDVAATPASPADGYGNTFSSTSNTFSPSRSMRSVAGTADSLSTQPRGGGRRTSSGRAVHTGAMPRSAMSSMSLSALARPHVHHRNTANSTHFATHTSMRGLGGKAAGASVSYEESDDESSETSEDALPVWRGRELCERVIVLEHALQLQARDFESRIATLMTSAPVGTSMPAAVVSEPTKKSGIFGGLCSRLFSTQSQPPQEHVLAAGGSEPVNKTTRGGACGSWTEKLQDTATLSLVAISVVFGAVVGSSVVWWQ